LQWPRKKEGNKMSKELALITSILGTVIGSLPIDPADQRKLRANWMN
jgi:hypothetical protein